MERDSIVEEVRRAREAYAAKFNFDLRAMCDDLRKQAEAAGVKTISLPPRPPRRSTTPSKKAG